MFTRGSGPGIAVWRGVGKNSAPDEDQRALFPQAAKYFVDDPGDGLFLMAFAIAQ